MSQVRGSLYDDASGLTLHCWHHYANSKLKRENIVLTVNTNHDKLETDKSLSCSYKNDRLQSTLVNLHYWQRGEQQTNFPLPNMAIVNEKLNFFE